MPCQKSLVLPHASVAASPGVAPAAVGNPGGRPKRRSELNELDVLGHKAMPVTLLDRQA